MFHLTKKSRGTSFTFGTGICIQRHSRREKRKITFRICFFQDDFRKRTIFSRKHWVGNEKKFTTLLAHIHENFIKVVRKEKEHAINNDAMMAKWEIEGDGENLNNIRGRRLNTVRKGLRFMQVGEGEQSEFWSETKPSYRVNDERMISGKRRDSQRWGKKLRYFDNLTIYIFFSRDSERERKREITE